MIIGDIIMYRVEDIAQWFINKAIEDAKEDNGDFITPLKLQKLLYYAQGCHLAIFDKPLFEDKIEAWKHGPVVNSIYEKYKCYGWTSINDPNPTPEFEYFVEKMLNDVNIVYGKYSAKQLVEMTHNEEPWQKTYNEQEMRKEIPQEMIKEYFLKNVVTKND